MSRVCSNSEGLTLLAYFKLRLQIFAFEIKHWSKQLEQALLLVSLFMGVAIPVLFYLLLLAFGAFLSDDTSTKQAALIAYSLILTQSILLQIFRAGILGSRYTLFLNTVSTSAKRRSVASVLLSGIANPLMGILVFILLSIEFTQWHKVPQGFALLSLQVMSTYLVLNQVKRFNISLAVSFLALLAVWFWPSNLDTWVVIAGFHFVMLASHLAPSSLTSLIPNLPPIKLANSIKLWFGIFVHKSASNSSNTPLLLLSGCVLLLLMSVYSAQQLPQYVQNISFIVLQFLVVLCVALQLSINRLFAEHRLFFAQYTELNSKFLTKQFLPVVLSLSIVLLVHFGIFSDFKTLLIQVPFALICLACAKRYPSMLIITWVLCIIVSGVVRFAFI